MNLLSGMSDEERLAFEQETGIRTEGAIRIVEEARQQTERMIQTAIREVQEVIGPHGSVTRVQAGGVRVSRTGIGVFEDGILKTVMESDGDFHVGSDTALPATTTFSVFVNDQTYNNEQMGQGDLLIGDNTDGMGNVKYDASEGQLQFREGATVRVYMDTDGTIKAGNGNVVIDEDGIVIVNEGTNDPFIIFRDSNDVVLGQIYTNSSGNLSLEAYGYAPGGERKLILRAQHDDGSTNISTIEIISNSGGNDFITLNSDFISFVAITSTRVNSPFVFNENGADFDARFEGDTDQNLTFWDASTDRVGIGTATPGYKLDVNGDLNVSGDLLIGGANSLAAQILALNSINEVMSDDLMVLYDESGAEAVTVVVANWLTFIADITAQTAPTVDDQIGILDVGAGTGRQVTLVDLLKIVNGLAADATPDRAADYVLTYDTSASAPKKVLLQNVALANASGTYTPTLTNTTNIDASAVSGPFNYMRIGDMVTVAGNITIDPTAAAPTNTLLGISLPIASNFTSTTEASGNGTAQATNTAGSIGSDATNDRVTLTFQATSTANTGWRVMFMYQVL